MFSALLVVLATAFVGHLAWLWLAPLVPLAETLAVACGIYALIFRR